MEEEYHVKLVDMPARVHSFVRHNPDGSETIVLNSRLNYESQVKCFRHEVMHLQNRDFDKVSSADEIESNAHNIGGD